MNCIDCVHGIVQEAALDRDRDLRSITSCDLLCREVVRLAECSRYREMKKEVDEVKSREEFVKEIERNWEEVRKNCDKPVIVDLGYGAVPKKKGWPLGKKRKK